MAHARVESVLARVLRFIVGCLMIAAVTVNFANVVGRYAFSKPLIWGEEVMQFMNVWAVMLGIAVITFHGSHLRMDAFYNLAPPALRRVLDAASNLLALLVFGYIIYQSAQMIGMLSTTGQRSVIARIPMNWMYAVIPEGLGSAELFLVVWFFHRWRGQATEEKASEPPERPELIG
jgi:TRAP-type C4-dicarboxylate transport system permease small subunit